MDAVLQALLAAIVSFFLVTIIFASIILICKSPKNHPTQQTQTRTRHRPARHPELSSLSVGESASFDPSLNQISMRELVAATKNFSADLIIGDGGFGLVYKAQLSSGVTVAIKKLDPDAFQGFREFRAEMETLSKLRHPNIVKILGYCVSGSERVLIYEFIEKGSLDQWLQDTSSESDSVVRLPLSWPTRNKIIMGVANGLSYLHGLETPIIHRDIKASNVLLDSEFEAHIADFGLARAIEASRSHVSTQFAGTVGYMPPEYKAGYTVATVKADVYSFGILMFEIATGRRPNLPVVLVGKEVGLVQWAREMAAQNRYMEMVDSNISRDGLVKGKIVEYFRVACNCTREISKERPSMVEVCDLLKKI